MKCNYKILKTFEKKDTRFTALIEYKGKKAILKQLTTANISLINNFSNEIDILNAMNKKYIPKVYEYGNDYIIMEYFEAYDNKPEKFAEYASDEIINIIVGQLIDINRTILENAKPVKHKLLSNMYKTILKLWINKYFKFYHIKLLVILTILYFKNKKLFNLQVATKGDFTEVNILVRDIEVKFIDFDTYTSNGAWLQDASYLLLHQDVKVEDLIWQKQFYKKYITKIDKTFIVLNEGYIRFWLLYTAINQFFIRYYQAKQNLIIFNKNEVKIKEEHIKYFLNTSKLNKFLIEIGINK